MNPLVVYLAGSRWDGPAGTDVRLGRALSQFVSVLWVEPPRSLFRRTRGRDGGLSEVTSSLHRLVVPTPPGVTRPGLRSLARVFVEQEIERSTRSLGCDIRAVVLATADGRFPRAPGARCCYYVTDDWPAGAALMGQSRQFLERRERRNARSADVNLAVSSTLAETVRQRTGCTVEVLLNGCGLVPTATDPADVALPQPVAGLVGQLNERIDLTLLEEVARIMSLVIVGPITARDTKFKKHLSALVAQPSVRWFDAQPEAALPRFFAAMAVGLTPYVDTSFNRSSFPLKTLEYLAAGLPCVSTPLASTGYLAPGLIDVASSPQEFAKLARTAACGSGDPVAREARVAFASRHTWQARARELLSHLDPQTSWRSSAACLATGSETR